MKSKKTVILELIFSNPKHWRFEELRREVQIGKPQLARWLRVLQEEGIINRVKPKGKMPYYVQNARDERFQNRKWLFAQEKLVRSGLLDHLASFPGAEVVVLFGSFSRWDWYADSDIDIFIYGDDSKFERGKYELQLGRDIEIFSARDAQGLKRIEKMLPSIVSGQFIRGAASDLGIEIIAKIQDAKRTV